MPQILHLGAPFWALLPFEFQSFKQNEENQILQKMIKGDPGSCKRLKYILMGDKKSFLHFTTLTAIHGQ